MNEEKVKNDIVVPFFRELGFDIADIEYETTLSIKLGRHSHEIDGEKERASGRLDILFKNGDNNLIVVETKPQDHELNEEDKEQAISYARLLKQIAPFAVLTNGIETKIYDVISMKELSPETINESEYVKNKYTISLDPELRYQALKKFIGLNFHNLKLFCQKQTDANLLTFIADADNPERKFIPETYLRREGLVETFNKFVEYKVETGETENNKKNNIVFGIIGESGFGKTNAMIDLVEEYGTSNAVLFFNGSRICRGILEEIAYDFNWEFEGDRTGSTIIKRLKDVFSQHKTKLLIFIDAVDEAPAKNFEIDLDNFVKNLSDDNIKVCLSCKESLWSRFLTISSDPSYIKSCLFLEKRNKDSPSSFTLKGFSNSELENTIEKYRILFRLPKIEGTTRQLCKNPLMLRIISEIYEDAENIPPNIVNQAVLGRYIDSKLKKSRTPQKDLQYLSIFGQKIFENNTELFYQDELNEGLDIPEYLISFSILKRIKDEIGRYLIGFEYDYIRDFIICYHSLKLDRLAPKQISELMERKIHENIARSVFSYFEMIAKNDVKKLMRNVFSNYNYGRAQEFIGYYQQILDTKFSEIKHQFYPFTKSEIGLLVFYHLNPYFAPIYGFRKVSGDGKKVIWLKKDKWFDVPKEVRWKIARRFGIGTLFTSSGFKEINPEEYARNSIASQLKKIIENRKLNEFNNFVLMEEFALEMMSNFSNWLDLPEFDKDFWKKTLPISVDDLIKRTRPMIQNIRSPLGRSIPPPPAFVKLLAYLHRLKRKKSTIGKTLLPFPSSTKIPRLGAWHANEYTLDELREYLTTYFQLVLQEYKILVDYNLPHLRGKMETYKTLPTRVVGEIEQKNMRRGFTYCLLPGKEEIKVEITFKRDESIFDPKEFIVHTLTGAVKISSYSSSVMYRFFDTDSGKDNVIQKAVYELIYDDLRRLYNW